MFAVQSDERLTLKVVGADGSALNFKIKKKTALRKLMKTYCERMVQSSLLEWIPFKWISLTWSRLDTK